MRRALSCCCICLLLAAVAPALAQDGDAVVVGSTEELFDLLRKQDDPEETGLTIDEALAAHLRGGEIDEGTYPPSDLWEQQFNPRRDEAPGLSHSGRLGIKYSKDDVSGVRKWEKELELNASYDDWDAYIRLTDFNTFAYNNDPFRWKKGRLRYRGENWRVTVGSVGAVFGRGLALNMFEDRFLEFDNETEGIRVDASLGKADLLFISGRRKNFGDKRHSAVTGIRWHAPVTRKVEVGAHFVDVEYPDVTFDPADSTLHNVNRVEALGADVTVRSGRFTGYGELVHVRRPVQPYGNDQFQVDGADGRGFYLNATYAAPGYAFIGEYKDYRRTLTPFAVPPSVRRWAEKSQSDPNNDRGYNFQFIFTPGPAAGTWQVAYGQDNKLHGTRPYTEFLASYTSATSRGGFSYVAEALTIFDEIQTIEQQKLTLNQTINDDWTSSALIQSKHHNPAFGKGYTYLLWDAELAYQSKLNLIYSRETTNQENAPTGTWDLWEVKFKPSEEQELNLIHGKRREGYVCSGGICRLEPAFEGTRFEYLLRF